jgi:hypothetical protein
MEEDMKVYRVLMGKPAGKRSPGRLRCGWEDGTRKDFRETDWSRVDPVGSG